MDQVNKLWRGALDTIKQTESQTVTISGEKPSATAKVTPANLDTGDILQQVISEDVKRGQTAAVGRPVAGDQPEGDGEEREQWGSQLDFLLSCVGYAVGLGNVWRFPYLCGRNGGAAFLIPYGIVLVFAGLPTFYLELAIGQFAGLTPHMLYRAMSPVFGGIGYTMVAISLVSAVYYNMIIATSMLYLFESIKAIFTWTLPWGDCDEGKPWIDDFCFDDVKSLECVKQNLTYFLGKCFTDETLASDQTLAGRILAANLTGDHRESPALQFNHYMLGTTREMQKTGISNGIGIPQWHLIAALFCSWILLFLCLVKGIKSSGKVVYFTATFPFVILFLLFFRGITLDGAYDGLQFYLVPNMTKLKESDVWRDAANQIFFSLSVGGGGLTTLATYNKFHNNLFRDTLIVVFGNCATSLFAGCVIFPILGFVAKQMYPEMDAMQRVGKIAASGPSLAFIAYPSAITRITAAPIWANLFFFMLIILGIDTQMVLVEVVMTALADQWPALRKGWNKTITVAIVSVICFALGIVLTTPGGDYLVNLLDMFAGGWTLVIACLVEIILVAWVYGVPSFVEDIELMLGEPPNRFYELLGYPVNWYWRVNWLVITPLLLFCILVFSFAQYSGLTYGDWTYPVTWEICGWFFTVLCVVWIPLYALYSLVTTLLSGEDWTVAFEKTDDWQPREAGPPKTEQLQLSAYDNRVFVLPPVPPEKIL